MDFVALPGLMIGLVALVFWLVPLVAGIWALVTLQQIRSTQHAVQAKLDAIERLLQRT